MPSAMAYNEMFLFVVGFLALFSPFGVVAPYAGLVEDYSPETKRRITLRVTLYSLLIVLSVGWGGQYLLTVLGITIPALTMTGGVILMLSSIPMVMKGHVSRKENMETEEIAPDSWRDIIIVPLTFPLSIGAGVISYVITYFAEAPGIAERMILSGLLCFGCFVIWLTFTFSTPLMNRMGPQGVQVIVRFGGIVIMCLAFMLLSRGLIGFFPALA